MKSVAISKLVYDRNDIVTDITQKKKKKKSQDRGARFYPFYLCGYP